MFGAQSARALSGLANQLAQSSGELFSAGMKLKNENDISRAKEIDAEAMKRQTVIETNYRYKSGKDAVEGWQQYQEELKKAREETIAAAGDNAAVKRIVSSAAATRDAASFGQGYSHYTQESIKYGNEASAARIVAASDAATTAQDEKRLDESLTIIESETNETAKRNGWSAERLAVETTANKSEAYAKYIGFRAMTDPEGAKSLYEKHKENIDGKTRALIEQKIQHSMATVGARQIAERYITGGQAVPGDANPKLRPFLTEGKDTAAVDNLDGNFAQRMLSAFEQAPPEIRAATRIQSGHRSIEEQQKLWDAALKRYGSAEEARKWVAPPGRSEHNHGSAIDLSYANSAARAWWHDNAARFGLKFSLGNEPWHIESAEGRAARGIGVSLRPEIRTHISTAASTHGQDINFLSRIAEIESSGDPKAVSPTGAKGLFQFTKDTWAQYGQGKDPFDPAANADAAARLTKDNREYLKSKIGRDPTNVELYMAHQQGKEVAEKFINNPDKLAKELTSEKNIRVNLPAGYDASKITAKEFMALWEKKYNAGGGTAAPTKDVGPITAQTSAAEIEARAKSARSDALARTGGDLRAADQAESNIRSEYNRLRSEEGVRKQEVRQELAEHVYGSTDPKRGIPPATKIEDITDKPGLREAFFSLPFTDQQQIRKQIEDNNNKAERQNLNRQPTTEDVQKYNAMHGLAGTNPEQFLATDIPSLQLPRTLANNLIKLQGQINEKGVSARENAQLDSAMKSVNDQIAAAGIYKDSEEYLALRGALKSDIQNYETTYKKAPSPTDIQGMMNNLLKTQYYEKVSFTVPGVGWQWKSADKRFTFQLTPERTKEFQEDMKKAGIENPTATDVRDWHRLKYPKEAGVEK